ncbi:MAG: DNA-binding response regulator [Candidatus Viridilinea halotolerans]|uniref:DNA-binding response regulator n=1 Tax=Candidatus Viridilinea halotolerans TaxID=2491704 RepID=A0A426U235_9CHLR|nr:MAG: DNA-binding response regulator [Candidatus Viridilinea halotolerans]
MIEVFLTTVLVVNFSQKNDTIIVELLAEAGYAVEQATGWSAFTDALGQQVDLLLFDALREDDLTWLPRLRTACQCPLVVIGPTRNSKLAVYTLDQGADDYILRPFHGGELLARLRAQLRRLFG